MTQHAKNKQDAMIVRDALAEFYEYTLGAYFADSKWDHEDMLNEALAALKRLEAGR